jgi:hypothetical protein
MARPSHNLRLACANPPTRDDVLWMDARFIQNLRVQTLGETPAPEQISR